MPLFIDIDYSLQTAGIGDTVDIAAVDVNLDTLDVDASASDATSRVAELYDLLDLEDGGTDTDATVTIDLAEDAFAFLTSGAGTSSATGDNATPAPPKDESGPPKHGFEWEMEHLNSARHTAIGAYLRGVLTGTY
ncbi:MAG: hypothetical protein KDJ77_05420 [Rhodobiaceae bacterium]|nr:hypothetical protein [Rhodobiaceae bacterium]